MDKSLAGLSQGTIDVLIDSLGNAGRAVPVAETLAVDVPRPNAIDNGDAGYEKQAKLVTELLEVWLVTKVRPEVEMLFAVRESRRPERFWTALLSQILAGMRRSGRDDSDILDITLTVRGGHQHVGRVKEVKDYLCFIEDTSQLFARSALEVNEDGATSDDAPLLDIATKFDQLQEQQEKERINREARSGSIRQVALRSLLTLRVTTLRDHALSLYQEVESTLARKVKVGGRYSPNSVAFQSTLGWVLEVDHQDGHETVLALELEGANDLDNIVLVGVNNYGLLVRDEHITTHSLIPDDPSPATSSKEESDVQAPDNYYFLPWDCVVSVNYVDPQRLEHIKKVAEQLMLQRAEEKKTALEEAKKKRFEI